MNISQFSISAARNAKKHSESDFGPSMVDPTVHNPSIQEILDRYTRTGQFDCSVRHPFYDNDDGDDFAPCEEFDDITDVISSIQADSVDSPYPSLEEPPEPKSELSNLEETKSEPSAEE